MHKLTSMYVSINILIICYEIQNYYNILFKHY